MERWANQAQASAKELEASSQQALEHNLRAWEQHSLLDLVLLVKTKGRQLQIRHLCSEDHPITQHSLHCLVPIWAREIISRRRQDLGSHHNQDKQAPALVEFLDKVNKALQDLVHRADLVSIRQAHRPDLYLEGHRQVLDLEEALEAQHRSQDKEQASSVDSKQLQAQEALGRLQQQEEGSSAAKTATIRQPELASLVHPAASQAQPQPSVSHRVLHSQLQPLEGSSVEQQPAPPAVSSGSLHRRTISPLDKLLHRSQQLLCSAEA